VRWIVELADGKLAHFATMAPLVVRDHVVVGVSGDVTDVRGFLESVDPETGAINGAGIPRRNQVSLDPKRGRRTQTQFITAAV